MAVCPSLPLKRGSWAITPGKILKFYIAACDFVIKPCRTRSVAGYKHEQSVSRSVRLSVCPVHCGKTADQIRMPFGIIVRTGPVMRQVVGFGDQSTGRGTFGANLGRVVVTKGDFTADVCDSAATRPSSQITVLLKLIVWEFLCAAYNLTILVHTLMSDERSILCSYTVRQNRRTVLHWPSCLLSNQVNAVEY